MISWRTQVGGREHPYRFFQIAFGSETYRAAQRAFLNIEFNPWRTSLDRLAVATNPSEHGRRRRLETAIFGPARALCGAAVIEKL
jgi:hypothetical protein